MKQDGISLKKQYSLRTSSVVKKIEKKKLFNLSNNVKKYYKGFV